MHPVFIIVYINGFHPSLSHLIILSYTLPVFCCLREGESNLPYSALSGSISLNLNTFWSKVGCYTKVPFNCNLQILGEKFFSLLCFSFLSFGIVMFREDLLDTSSGCRGWWLSSVTMFLLKTVAWNDQFYTFQLDGEQTTFTKYIVKRKLSNCIEANSQHSFSTYSLVGLAERKKPKDEKSLNEHEAERGRPWTWVTAYVTATF